MCYDMPLSARMLIMNGNRALRQCVYRLVLQQLGLALAGLPLCFSTYSTSNCKATCYILAPVRYIKRIWYMPTSFSMQCTVRVATLNLIIVCLSLSKLAFSSLARPLPSQTPDLRITIIIHLSGGTLPVEGVSGHLDHRQPVGQPLRTRRRHPESTRQNACPHQSRTPSLVA